MRARAPDQAYAFPAMDLDLKVVRTNLAPRTIVRGPGFTNSVMIIEQVLQPPGLCYPAPAQCQWTRVRHYPQVVQA